MTIWMVTGLHRHRWTDNVLRNFRRQEWPQKRLIVVLNGECENDSACVWAPDVVILRSGADPAKVMNGAIQYLRINADPNDWFCKCDADDYYGPMYLQHVAECDTGDFSGLKSVYVKTMDDMLWFAEGNERTAIVHGPTIAGKVGTALPFTEGLDWGEDTEWCEKMQRAGRERVLRPADGFCYQRWGNNEHAWPCTDEELLAAWPIPMYELGPFDENVVDGLKEHKYSKLLEQRELTAKNSMPVRVLINRLTKGNNMKTIKVPDYTVMAPDGVARDCVWFAMFLANNHSGLNSEDVELESSARIAEAFKDKRPGAEVTLDDRDWTRLVQAAKKPSCGYPVQPARAALPWIEAIRNAT